MAINIKFDLTNNPEPPTIVLAKRNGDKLGQLKVDAKSIELGDKFNDASEISFTLNKYIDGKITNLWDDVVDFKLIHCKEWDMWFQITVELDEETETVKTVFCTQLGQAELSQIKIYNLTINQEGDSNWDKTDMDSDYKKTILFNPNDTEASLLHRLLKDKALHYSIKHVDDTIANVQRMFSFDDVSIHDAFTEIGEEIGCLFVYDSNSDKDGKIQRTISVYDLQQTCLNPDCSYKQNEKRAYRGEFTDKCPKCGSTNIKYGYGEDTTIFVTSDELANGGIQLQTDTDSVKNCFKLEAGDDLMTATIRNCNPNGTDYIWYFSDDMKADMSEELSDKIETYDDRYKEYYNDYVSNIDVSSYNTLVNKYKAYNEDLQTITTPIKGYSALMNTYYNTVDLALYLESGLMPSVEIAETNAEEQAALLTSASLSPVAVGIDKISSISLATANSAVLSMAKTIVKSTFKVEIEDSSISNDKTTWTGSFVVTNYSDEEDVVVSNTVSVTINNDVETFIEQKIDKALNKENTDDMSISGLFAKDYDDFCAELKKYALNPLTNFYDACEACLSIMQEQGVASEEVWSDNAAGSEANLYEKLYLPYYNKLLAIASEIKVREDEIAVIEGVFEADKDGNEVLKTKGIQHYINECKDTIQAALNFEDYIGTDLWMEFCSYRREDKYSNDNYISDGLNNAELFGKAKEFIKVAEDEIYKSAELQHSISTSLKNLLAIKKFKPLVKHFSVGNWIRIQADEEVYKLRLLEYSIDYGSFESIPVTFSDITKVKTGITDVQDVLAQASSMATSYSSVQKQAEQGEQSKGTIDQWLSNGLNSAQVRIQNNTTEDIILDKNGLLCRSYNDITDTYDSEQLKITHNIMAYTDDNWKTVRQAIGKHDYITYNANLDTWGSLTGYGMSADFVSAGQIMGSKIVGGEIYSNKYCSGKSGTASGTYINLETGDFEIGGGKLIYDSLTKNLTLDGVTINWKTTNAPDVDLSGLDDAINELDESVARHLGLGGTTILDEKHVISPYIAGGYLNITNTDNNSKVIIDPNNLTGNNYIFQVYNGSQVTVGVDNNGNATFAGDIYATSLTLGKDVKINTSSIDGIDAYATKNSLNVYIEKDGTLGTLPPDGATDGGAYQGFKVSTDGLLTASNALIYGSVYATNGRFAGEISSASGDIGGWNIDDTTLWCEIIPPNEEKMTDADPQKILDYCTELIELTEEELKKYDLDKNGKVDTFDALLANMLAKANISSKEGERGKLLLDSTDWLDPIKILDGEGNVTASFGIYGASPAIEPSDYVKNSTASTMEDSATGVYWKYHRWESGFLELWGYRDITLTTDDWVAWGDLYYATIPSVALDTSPKFKEIYSSKAYAYDATGTRLLIQGSYGHTTISSDTHYSVSAGSTGKFAVVRANKPTSDMTVRVVYEITGEYSDATYD